MRGVSDRLAPREGAGLLAATAAAAGYCVAAVVVAATVRRRSAVGLAVPLGRGVRSCRRLRPASYAED
jgi:hypothetical protein